ncbi:hypothetical protein IMG5_121540 [Ichthyophthirius multifiliis]|uniref:CCDC81 HU domain-containing protein n=1 Tax=Ichthyophthirius multifiliis TaxID=5932 RepID=G0QV66_ICHMU|nr:hypothetical protein IMG5_121540 [Ichthyophthirius multifiliis]EGR30907.1 hypothetical protein IMG5_121540 [Ichthyophthirius multifiliis]|eukprot:XP_004032494.1 hypothetical protein IMG5_121540 [Ichthyophthirius multifiliis]
MTFCNAGPIAASCFLGKDVVESAHYAFICAVQDLTTLGYSLNIDFQFIKLTVNNKNLQYQYNQEFLNTLNSKNFEIKVIKNILKNIYIYSYVYIIKQLRKSNIPTSEYWTMSYLKNSDQNSLNTLLKRPNSKQVRYYNEKTQALKIMSLDLSTAEYINYSQKQKILPQLQKK